MKNISLYGGGVWGGGVSNYSSLTTAGRIYEMTGRASEISEADERSEGSFWDIQIPHLLKFFFAAKYLFHREGSPRGGEGFGLLRCGGGVGG